MTKQHGLAGFLVALSLTVVSVFATVPPAPEANPALRERIALTHTMEYEYDRPVLLAPHIVRLLPQSWTPATLTRSDLLIKVAGTYTLRRQSDLENNLVAGIRFDGATKFLTVQNHLEMTVPVRTPPVDLQPEPRAAAFPIEYTADETKRLAACLELSKTGPRFATFFEKVPDKHTRSLKWLGEVTKRIRDEVKYLLRREEGVLTPDDTLERGGSCRDFAWLLVQILRRKGVPARFVSGYQIPAEVLANRDSKVYNAELHAWVEAYLPGCGWVGLDPTSGTWTNTTYLPLVSSATTRDAGPLDGSFSVANPTPGVFATSTLTFKITVQCLGPMRP